MTRKGYSSDPEAIKAHLSNTSTAQECCRALLSCGIPAQAIAEATKVTTSSVRNWSTGVAKPRDDSYIVLDDIRFMAFSLVSAGLSPERSGLVIKSRFTEAPYYRPIEIVTTNPQAAFEIVDKTIQKLMPPQGDPQLKLF